MLFPDSLTLRYESDAAIDLGITAALNGCRDSISEEKILSEIKSQFREVYFK